MTDRNSHMSYRVTCVEMYVLSLIILLISNTDWYCQYISEVSLAFMINGNFSVWWKRWIL